MVTVKITVNVDYCYLSGVPAVLSMRLSDSLRYFSIAANEYNSAYTSGRWDGFIRLYDSFQHRFPTGLLEKVKGIIKDLGLEYALDKSRLPALDIHTALPYQEQYPLRGYQRDAVEAMLKWKRGVVVIPTGGGKTEVAQAVIARSGVNRVAFLVPNRALLKQSVHRLRAAFPETQVIPWGDGDHPPSEDRPESYILVATTQSAKKGHALLRSAQMLIIDEAHHQAAAMFQEATRNAANARYIFGLTATPEREDRADMEVIAWTGPLIYKTDYDSLIAAGYLVPPNFVVTRTLTEGLEKTAGRRTIIFSEKLADLTAMAPELTEAGVVILTGRDSTKKIQATLEAFRSGKVTHIAATPIFDEGLDVPDLECVFFMTCCGSKTKALQRIGRAMRPGKTLTGEEKKECLVVDINDKQYRRRMAAYLSEPSFRNRIRV